MFMEKSFIKSKNTINTFQRIYHTTKHIIIYILIAYLVMRTLEFESIIFIHYNIKIQEAFKSRILA